MATSPVRIGLVGYGFGGRYFHAPLIAAAAECDLVGVVTRDAGRRAELAADHPGVPAYDDLAAVKAAGAEAVAISTPVATHAALLGEAIELGLAVVCDKPFARDAAAATAALDRARARGVPLTVYQNRRWDSDFLTLCRLVAAGEIGEVRRFESRFERFKPQPGPKIAGGGGLLDFGTHLVDQALHLLGPADEVYAEAHLRDDGLDDDFFLALTHHSGAISHLWGSWLQGAPGPRLRVTGSTGTFVIDDVDGQEDALRAGASPASLGDAWGAEPPERWGRLRRGEVTQVVASERGRWDTFYPAFARAVRGEGPLPVDPADAVAALRVLDAARAAAGSGTVRLAV